MKHAIDYQNGFSVIGVLIGIAICFIMIMAGYNTLHGEESLLITHQQMEGYKVPETTAIARSDVVIPVNTVSFSLTNNSIHSNKNKARSSIGENLEFGAGSEGLGCNNQ